MDKASHRGAYAVVSALAPPAHEAIENQVADVISRAIGGDAS